MDHYANDTELIVKYVKELKLPTVKDSLEDIIADADAERDTCKLPWHNVT